MASQNVADNTIWEYLVETPPLTDCLASFATSHEQVRCAVMVYLIEIALADRILAAGEDEALLQARTCLRISQKQIEAIERYICNVGLIRARPRDYHEGGTSLKYKYGLWLVAGVSLSAMALYFSSIIGGVSLPEMVSGFPRPGVGRALLLGAGATALIGTAAVLTGRWLYARYQRKRLPIARERRRRAQAACAIFRMLSATSRRRPSCMRPSEIQANPAANTSLAVRRALMDLAADARSPTTQRSGGHSLSRLRSRAYPPARQVLHAI